jgi:nicotinate-nucleotide pyrophosphorylase (carboxylating)
MVTTMNSVLFSLFQKKEKLSVENHEYQHILDTLFSFFVQADHIAEDITTEIFLSKNILRSVQQSIIIAKSSCIIAGIEEILYLAKKHTNLVLKTFCQDGDHVMTSKKIISLAGTAREILAHERIFLNILQRMSGIATETFRYISAVADVKNPPLIAATRKTPWMHVDKKAVSVAGGATHRLDLRDGILLKDNHLELLKRTQGLRTEADAIWEAIEHVQIPAENISLEVEVKTDDSALVAVKAWRKLRRKNPFIILLDNFTPQRAKKVIQQIRHIEAVSGSKKVPEIVRQDSSVFFEASGGITFKNVKEWAQTGVDVISIGSLTHSPKAADLSMDILSP